MIVAAGLAIGCCPVAEDIGTCSAPPLDHLSWPDRPPPDASNPEALPDHDLDGTPFGPLVQLAIGDGGPECGRRERGAVQCWSGPSPAGAFTDLSAGGDTACGVREDGSIHCWAVRGDPVLAHAVPTGAFSTVSVDDDAACALTTEGAAVCWGDAPTPPVAAFVAVEAGSQLSCGLLADDSALCWDDVGGFALDGAWVRIALSGEGWGIGLRPDGTTEQIGTPPAGLAPLPAGPDYDDVDVGISHTACGVDTDHVVSCNDPMIEGQTPGPVHRLWATDFRVCGTTPEGAATCWDGSPTYQR